MESPQLIESVARAIAGSRLVAEQSGAVGDNGLPMRYEDVVELKWPLYRYDALCAIRAMRAALAEDAT